MGFEIKRVKGGVQGKGNMGAPSWTGEWEEELGVPGSSTLPVHGGPQAAPFASAACAFNSLE